MVFNPVLFFDPESLRRRLPRFSLRTICETPGYRLNIR